LKIDVILIVTATVHAYLFAVLLLLSKRRSARILGVYMLCTFFTYAVNANMYFLKISTINYLFYYFIPFASLTLLPLMYIYVSYISSETYVFRKRDFFHFLPAILWFLIVTSFLLSLPQEVRGNIIHGYDKESDYYRNVRFCFLITNALIFLQVFIYSGLMLNLLIKHKKTLEKIYSFKEMLSLNWLLIFVSVFFAYYLFEFIVFVSLGMPVNLNVYFLIITLHVFFVGVMGYKQRDIYNKNRFFHLKHFDSGHLDQNEQPENLIQKLRKNTPVSEEETFEIVSKIRFLMETKKIFVNPELSLYDLAHELNIHKNYLSHIINEEFGVNFYTFINSYRIEEAKQLLTDERNDKLSIEGIAQNVGFKTRHVFYPVFKKTTGLTPAAFKKKYKQD